MRSITEEIIFDFFSNSKHSNSNSDARNLELWKKSEESENILMGD